MPDKREVSIEKVEKFKRERNIDFSFETSAMTGENIEDLFIIASKLLYNNFKDKIAQMVSNNLKLITQKDANGHLFKIMSNLNPLFSIFQKDEAMKKRKTKKLKKAADKGSKKYNEEQKARQCGC